jgi:hypothetical protein
LFQTHPTIHFLQEQFMDKRKLAALVAASFAGLMLSSPSFAADADKAKDASGSPTTAQTAVAPESRSIERADKRAVVSKKAAAAAKADYKAAVEKCDAQPATERGTCMQEAKDAQSLAMNKGRDGSPATRSGAPKSRIVGPQSAK